MKWWYWLILELLIIFGITAWIYFFPSEFEYNFAKGMFGFGLLYCIEGMRNNMGKTYTIEQNAGENRIEGGVVGISGSAKVYTCKDCLRHQFCYLAKERKDKACSKISLYEETEKQYRPFKDCNELIEHYQKMVNAEIGEKMIYPSLYKPVIWVKSKSCDDCQLMITGYSVDDEEKSVVWLTDSWITLEKLFDDWLFLDDSPIGMEV